MTACVRLLRTFQQRSRLVRSSHCASCVYFSKNLDSAEYPVLIERKDYCGLGFEPGDVGCTEMRTENCSMRKR